MADILPFGQPTDAPGPRFVRAHRPVDLEPLRETRHLTIRPGLLDRIADWLGTDRGFSFFLGFYSGIMFCCGTAILWVLFK